MKKLIGLSSLAILVAGVIMVAFGDDNYKPISLFVTDNSTGTMLLPAVNPKATNAWQAATSTLKGSYVRVYTNTQWRYWFATVTGTTGASEPTWSFTNDVTDNSVTWRPVQKVRNHFYVVNDGSASAVYLSFGTTPITNAGIRVNSGGGSFSMNAPGCYQGEIWAISPTAKTNNVTVQELP